MKLLKILSFILSSALFIPVSCTSIEVALLKLEMPREEVKPNSRYYPLFFRVALLSNGQVDYPMLSNLDKFKKEHSSYSFLLPNPPLPCEAFTCYRIVSDNGTEQTIEVMESPDSLFAIKVWSRYRATHADFTPISLKKLSMNILFYALACSLFLYGIGQLLRKKIMSKNAAG